MRPAVATALCIAVVGTVVAAWRMRRGPAASESAPAAGITAGFSSSRVGSSRVVGSQASPPVMAPTEASAGRRNNGERDRAFPSLQSLQRAVAEAARGFEGVERDRALQALAAEVARQTPAWGHDAVATLEEHRARQIFVRAFVETLAAATPPAAAAWVDELTDPALRDGAYNVLGMRWADGDLAAARAWALDLHDGSARGSAMDGVIWSWAQRDPRAVYDWAVGLTDQALREQVMVKTAKMLAVQSPRQALEWVLQFPDGASRDQALQYTVFHWAAQDLSAAAEWSAKVSDSALRTNSELAIARSWSTQEAQGATLWAAAISDPVAQAVALKTTLRKWAEVNPVAAAAWMAQRQPSAANEDVFRSVTSELVNSNAATATSWLRGFDRPDWRRILDQLPAEPRPETKTSSPSPSTG